jgi:hypothetical protein
MGKTIIESPVVRVSKSQEELFDLLSDARNFEQIMPDQVVNFKGEQDRFKFGIQGLPEVGLQVVERIPHNKIVLEDSSGKIGFKLVGELTAVDAGSAEAKMYFEGEFNPMLRMMIEKPLKKFIEDLSAKLAKI